MKWIQEGGRTYKILKIQIVYIKTKKLNIKHEMNALYFLNGVGRGIWIRNQFDAGMFVKFMKATYLS